MELCGATKRNGGWGKAPVLPGERWYWGHHPDYAEARKRNGAKSHAGRSVGREVRDIKGQLEDLTRRVLGEAGSARIDTARAAVANQLINTRLRAVEIERRIKETEEL